MSNSKDWAAIIPEFYYDLISRIPAGMVLLSVIGISVLSQDQMSVLKAWLFAGKIEGFPFTIIFIIFFCTGYVVSIPLTMLGACVRKLYGHFIWALIKKAYAAEVQGLERQYESKADESRFYCLIHDDLKQNNPHALLLLPKMSAEVSLCDNLTAAFVLAVLFVSIFSSVSIKFPAYFLCIATFCFVSAGYRFHQLMARHISFAIRQGIKENAQQSH